MLSLFPGTRALKCLSLFLKNNINSCAWFKLEELSSCLSHDTNGYYDVNLSQVIFPSCLKFWKKDSLMCLSFADLLSCSLSH